MPRNAVPLLFRSSVSLLRAHMSEAHQELSVLAPVTFSGHLEAEVSDGEAILQVVEGVFGRFSVG